MRVMLLLLLGSASARARPRRATTLRATSAWELPRGGGAGDACAADLQELLDLRGDDIACIIEVGAAWCEPCKALAPVLAAAAEASKGTLIVRTVDVDAERGVAEALEASQLPALYAVRDGALVDALVGMPRTQEELSGFVMRAMGGGSAAAAAAQPARTTALARVVGFCALGAQGREELEGRVRAALAAAREVADADDARKAAVLAALRAVRAFLARSYAGGPLACDDDAYAKIAPVESATEILFAAGYALIPGDPDDDDEDARKDKLHPTHRNLAAFELCATEIDRAIESY